MIALHSHSQQWSDYTVYAQQCLLNRWESLSSPTILHVGPKKYILQVLYYVRRTKWIPTQRVVLEQLKRCYWIFTRAVADHSPMAMHQSQFLSEIILMEKHFPYSNRSSKLPFATNKAINDFNDQYYPGLHNTKDSVSSKFQTNLQYRIKFTVASNYFSNELKPFGRLRMNGWW